MTVQIQPTHKLAPLGFVLLAAALACGGGGDRPENQVRRQGEDVLASGSEPTVRDSVPGDAILAGGNVGFSGAVGGDYLGAGGNQAIGGRIHGSLRAAGGNVHVAATVDRNTTLAGGSVVLDSAAVIARNAYIFGGTVQVNGTVREGILASGGTVTINGVVGRDVEVAAGELRIGPQAQIAGNLRYRVPAGKFRMDPAAHVSGTVTALPTHKKGWGLFRVLWLLGFLAAGAVVVALLPRFTSEAAEIMTASPGKSALVGLGWIFFVPVAIVVAAVTVIGIPLAFVICALYVVLLYLARATVAVWLGRRVLGARAREGREGVLMNFLVGGLILLILGIIPVIGSWVLIVVTVFGLGTIILRAMSLREERVAGTGQLSV